MNNKFSRILSKYLKNNYNPKRYSDRKFNCIKKMTLEENTWILLLCITKVLLNKLNKDLKMFILQSMVYCLRNKICKWLENILSSCISKLILVKWQNFPIHRHMYRISGEKITMNRKWYEWFIDFKITKWVNLKYSQYKNIRWWILN